MWTEEFWKYCIFIHFTYFIRSHSHILYTYICTYYIYSLTIKSVKNQSSLTLIHQVHAKESNLRVIYLYKNMKITNDSSGQMTWHKLRTASDKFQLESLTCNSKMRELVNVFINNSGHIGNIYISFSSCSGIAAVTLSHVFTFGFQVLGDAELVISVWTQVTRSDFDFCWWFIQLHW